MNLKILQFLSDPGLAPLYTPGIAAAFAVALMGAPLAVLVCLKRMAFIGQGISHAAFGGIGIAAVLGLTATALADAPAGGLWQFLVVTCFCLGAALSVGFLADKTGSREDTVIGIVLVGSMALGAVLLRYVPAGVEWESLLFGTIYNVTDREASISWGAALATLGALWCFRRSLLFWAFDEPGASAFGVRAAPMKVLLLTLLAVATVTAMKLAGVVLATALLVLPGAVALRLSSRLGAVLALSITAALLGVALGVVISFQLDWPPGPAIVLVLILLYALARLAPRAGVAPRVPSAPAPGPPPTPAAG